MLKIEFSLKWGAGDSLLPVAVAPAYWRPAMALLPLVPRVLIILHLFGLHGKGAVVIFMTTAYRYYHQ